MLLLPDLPIRELKGFSELRAGVEELKLRLIFELVKDGLGGRDALLGMLLGAHGNPGIGHVGNRLELVLVHDFDRQAPSRLHPHRQVLEERVQLPEVVDTEIQQAGVRELPNLRRHGRIGVPIPPFQALMLFLRQRRGRLHLVLGIVQHCHGLVQADHAVRPRLGKGAGRHAGAAADIQHAHLLDFFFVLLPPVLNEKCGLRLKQIVVLEDFAVDGRIEVIVDVLLEAVCRFEALDVQGRRVIRQATLHNTVRIIRYQ